MPRKIVDPKEARMGHTCHLDHDITLTFKFPQGKVTSATEKRRARGSLSSNSASPFRVTPAYSPPKLMPREGSSYCDCHHLSDFCTECDGEGNKLEEYNGGDYESSSYYENDENIESQFHEEMDNNEIDNNEDLDIYFRDYHDETEENIEIQEARELQEKNEIQNNKNTDILETVEEKQRAKKGSYIPFTNSSSKKSSRLSTISSPTTSISPQKKSKIHTPLQTKEQGKRSSTSPAPQSSSSSSPLPSSNSNSSKYINYLSSSKRVSSDNSPIRKPSGSDLSISFKSPQKQSNIPSSRVSLTPTRSVSSNSSRSSISSKINSPPPKIKSSSSKTKSISNIPIGSQSISSSNYSPNRYKSPSSIPVRTSSTFSPSKTQSPDVLTPTPSSPSKIPISTNSTLLQKFSPTRSSYEPNLHSNSDTSRLISSNSEISLLRESNDFPIQELFPLKSIYSDDFEDLEGRSRRTKKEKESTSSSAKSKRNSISTLTPPNTSKINKRQSTSSLSPVRKSSISQDVKSPARRSSISSSIPFQNSNSRLESRKSLLLNEDSSASSNNSSLNSSKIFKSNLPSASISAHFAVNSLAILGFSSSEYTELFSGIAIDLEPLTIKAFDKPNPKMLLVILHFLLVILDSENFPSYITQCWPYLDNSERTAFRRACYTSLTFLSDAQNEIKDDENFSSPLLLPSHFSPKILQESYGVECWELIRILCDLCLEKEFENPHDPLFVDNSNNIDIYEQIKSNMIAIQQSTEQHLSEKKEISEYLNELQERYLQCKKIEISDDNSNFINEIKQCNILISKINSKKEILTSLCSSSLFPHVNILLQEESEKLLEELPDNSEEILENSSDLSLAKVQSRQKLRVDPSMRQFQFKMSEAIETLTKNLSVLCENLHIKVN